VGRLGLLEGPQLEGEPGMARRDEVVADFPGRAIGRGRAAHMAARALLRAHEGIGEIDHALRVAGGTPAWHRVGHQPVAGRAVA